jgi:hypothetical protein
MKLLNYTQKANCLILQADCIKTSSEQYMTDIKQRTLEQVYRSAVNGLYSRLKSYYDFIYREYGDDGLKLISRMSREYGLTIVERAKTTLKDNSLSSVSKYILRIFETVAWEKNYANHVYLSDTKVIIKVDECPLHFNNVQQCLAHTTMEKTVVEELNPELIYHIGKSIPAGDAYCEHIIEKKNTV